MIPLKLALTAVIVALLTQPLWAPQWGGGILAEIGAFGPAGAAIVVLVFFSLVALYCLSLQRMLEAIAPAKRAASPRSVWLMFVIPSNFVEDFFIVGSIAASLRNDGRTHARTQLVWLILGMSWCGLQIVSLLPGPVGVVSGGIALLAWAAHWMLTNHMTRALLDSSPSEVPAPSAGQAPASRA
ncbi:hypothetical protein [Methylobacterium nodulans]|uniref:Uncharacterized protein n=1 Tax=Methylobacterium nodulans (strain LMG 21967 / CNCM I-2342 / ORS 2060) TaxID=460265 RepID=B8IWN0_METNO|nr:hypothetical protein [Methylobacterium nodulans]ACL62921.1 conserved hypothetical protein [Methylobacterium nodulans ORS 2060]